MFGLLLITGTLLHAGITWLMTDSLILIGLLFSSRFPLRQLLRDIRAWSIFLLLLFLIQVFLTPGPRLPTLPWLPATLTGLHLGAVTGWRLGLILGYVTLFTSVTRPRELQDSIIWLLKPIPFLVERRIGIMVSLTLRFFSVVLDLAEEIRLANRARLGDRVRNPLRKAKFLVLPLFRRSFGRVEDVTLALAARGFHENVPVKLPSLRISHLLPLFVFVGLLLAL
jgi:biotin transport system permease protein